MKNFIRILPILMIAAGYELFAPDPARGEMPSNEVSFPYLWELVQKHAPSEKVTEYELKSSLLEKERDLRQGYPRLYLDTRAFSTNDPALSFISILNQRQIHTSDFAPDLLNGPGYQFYQKATLGADWPFYDGGARSARLQSQEKTILARTFEQKNGVLDLYNETASLFGSALIYDKHKRELKKLLETTENILEHYRIGVKSNPLGYSGLLGLKTLKNKINGALAENDARLNSAKEALEEQAVELPKSWNPLLEPGETGILPFVQTYLNPPKNKPAEGVSPQTLMLQAEAEASEKQIEGERAKKRPRVGLFSEAYLNNGNRDLASSYVLGLYLKWDLFAMDNYKKVEQAHLSSLSLKAKAEDFRLHEKIETENALLASRALEKQIALMAENSKFMEEQSQTSRKLFLNGSINVLQFVDVLNRNFDLLINLTDAESRYLKTIVIQAKGSGFEIPAAVKGSPHDP